MYSFSLEKLNSLVSLKYFAFIYSHYFNVMINNRNRIESKKTMFKHYCSYIEAFNLVLRLSKETLKKVYIKASEQNYSEEYL